MSIDFFEHELTLEELEEIKRNIIAHKHYLEFNIKMGFNYDYIDEKFDYIDTILVKIDKMIKRQKDMLANAEARKSSYYNEDEEIISDGDVPF